MLGSQDMGQNDAINKQRITKPTRSPCKIIDDDIPIIFPLSPSERSVENRSNNGHFSRLAAAWKSVSCYSRVIMPDEDDEYSSVFAIADVIFRVLYLKIYPPLL